MEEGPPHLHPLRPPDRQLLPAARVVFLKCRVTALRLHLQGKSQLHDFSLPILPASQRPQHTVHCYCTPVPGMPFLSNSPGKLSFQNPVNLPTSSVSLRWSCPTVSFSGLGTPGLWPHLTMALVSFAMVDFCLSFPLTGGRRGAFLGGKDSISLALFLSHLASA